MLSSARRGRLCLLLAAIAALASRAAAVQYYGSYEQCAYDGCVAFACCLLYALCRVLQFWFAWFYE